jgi:hypothetical protein
MKAQYATVFLPTPPATEVGRAIGALAEPAQYKGFSDCANRSGAVPVSFKSFIVFLKIALWPKEYRL